MIKTQLEQYLRSQLEGSASRQILKGGGLTIGVEHEFFLLGSDGLPATHAESQRFLEFISKEPKWIVRENRNSNLGNMITRLSLEHDDQTYTVLKYDHHPHLLEISTRPFHNLHELGSHLDYLWDLIQVAANSTGLAIFSSGTIEIPADHQRLVSDLDEFVQLRKYRENLLAINKTPADLILINYAASIAATQVHIGNSYWWNIPSYVETLYSYETAVAQITSRGSNASRRWSGYMGLFSNYPLVGFPNMPAWSMDNWLNALIKSPLAFTDSEHSFGNVHPSGGLIFSNPANFFKSARDLQLIRPKLFGTLEFRGDPAQSSVAEIVETAAIRLGICSFLLNNEPKASLKFAEERATWLDYITSNKFTPSRQRDVVEMASQGLKSRGIGEEKLLGSRVSVLAGGLNVSGG